MYEKKICECEYLTATFNDIDAHRCQTLDNTCEYHDSRDNLKIGIVTALPL